MNFLNLCSDRNTLSCFYLGTRFACGYQILHHFDLGDRHSTNHKDDQERVIPRVRAIHLQNERKH